jgi:hypothetical protein
VTSTVVDEAVCALSVPTGLPPGTFGVYSADYRAFVNDGDTASLKVDHNGTTDASSVAGPENGVDPVLTHVIGSGPSGTIDSAITLGFAMVGATPTFAEIDSVDYAELGRTTTNSVRASIDQLAAGRTATVIHLNAASDLLTSGNQPVEASNNVSLVGGLGSYTVGVTGHFNLSGGFSLDGGGALIHQAAGGSSTSGLLVAGAVRYLQPGVDRFRPFGRVGFDTAELGMTFSRHYSDGSPSGATVVASTTGSLTGAFAEAGVLYAVSPNNAFAFSATFMRNWLGVNGYSETFRAANLFPATVASSTESFDTVKATAAWTKTIAPDVDLTLSGAFGKTFSKNSVPANVAFVGAVISAPQDDLFAEYGARIGWQLSPIATADLFVFGATGVHTGTHVQVGGALRMQF